MHPTFYKPPMASDYTVVDADPEKLAPYLMALYAQDPIWYGEAGRKRKLARQGLLSAKTEITTPTAIVTPVGSPLPMPYMGCFTEIKKVREGFWRRSVIQERPMIGFIDGVTRSLELLKQGAAFIPIEVHHREAAQLHAMGGLKPPESVAAYAVPPDVGHKARLQFDGLPSR